MKKAVFLDRDGTVIFDEGYISEPAKVELIPDAAEALRKLSKEGYLLVIATNQSGIGRAYFSEKEMRAVNDKMLDLLAKEKVLIRKIYFCPHKPEDCCECRKPKPGLLLKAQEELDIDVSVSAMIGDKISDISAGINAGCKYNLLISSEKAISSELPKGAVIFNSLVDAADYILRHTDNKPNPDFS